MIKYISLQKIKSIEYDLLFLPNFSYFTLKFYMHSNISQKNLTFIDNIWPDVIIVLNWKFYKF